MLWSIICLAACWFGFEIVHCFAPKIWDSLNILGTGIPLGITLTAWIFLILRSFFDLTPSLGFLISNILIFISFILHYYCPKKRLHTRPITLRFFILMIFLIILYYILTDVSILKDGYLSSGTVFSDLPFHMSLISSFAYGVNSKSRDLLHFKTTFFLWGISLLSYSSRFFFFSFNFMWECIF